MKLLFTVLILFTFFFMSAQNYLSVEYVTGKFDPTHHPDFTAVSAPYSLLPAQFLKNILVKKGQGKNCLNTCFSPILIKD